MTNIYKTALLVCTVAVFMALSSHAAKTAFIENEQVIVQYDKSLQKVAERTIEIYAVVKEQIEHTFGADINFRPLVRLVKDRDTFNNFSGQDKVVAVAFSNQDLIVIDNSRMKTRPFSLSVTLKHELCHLFLHHYVENGKLPKWLNEGISQWVSDGIAELIIGENKNLLKQAVLSDRLIPIHELSTVFPNNEKALLLAYEESKSIVEYIIKEHDVRGIILLLDHFKSGKNPEEAVLSALSLSIPELEQRWMDSLKVRITWLTYLSSHLYQILFSLAALLLVYGFVRSQIRKRNYKDEEDEIEDERI